MMGSVISWQGMGRGLENPRLITARGQAAGGVKHVYSVLIRVLYIIFFL